MVKALVDYARGSAILHAMFLIVYGVITFAYRDALWSESRVYDTIGQLPKSPESWGALAVAFGVIILIGVMWANERIISVGCFLGAVWCIVFAITFLIDFILDKNTPITLVGFSIYVYTALIMLHRVVLGQRLQHETTL